MHLLIISGFLGSGKTSILLQLARELTERGKRIAIIENEVGEVGVDDAIVREAGLQVKEIFSGCVCCSLRIDLINTLLEVEREIAPDVVILEPSGVAGPKQLLRALDGYGGEIDSRRVLAVVDAVRFQRVNDLFIPLIRDGVNVADVIALNKIDAAEDETVQETIQKICSVRSDVDIVEVSAENRTNMEVLFDHVLGETIVGNRSIELDADPPIGPRPTAFAQATDVHIENPEAFQKQLCSALTVMANDLKSAGCELIGHLKASVRTARGGFLSAGTTDFDSQPSCKGRLHPSVRTGKLSLNVIVYGVDEDTVGSIAVAATNTMKSEE